MGNLFQVEDAKREKIWVKIALMSPSGGGKTYSALRLATGMKDELARMGVETNILMGNTEGSRGRIYANEFKYKIVDIPQDSDPEVYADFIKFAVDNNYKILIIDSSTHEWKKALKIHQQNGGDFKAFAKVTPRHEKFTGALADSPIHIISTIRGEDKYEVEKNDAGKTSVKKLGVGADQRKDFEFEFMATFLIDQKTNTAEVQKDNTHLFESRGASLLTEQDGVDIIKWANSGEGYTVPVRETKVTKVVLSQEVTLKDKVIALATIKLEVNKIATKEAIKKYGTNNPKNIEKEEDLKNLLADLEKIVAPVATEVKAETKTEQA
jgi:hypothetical protein